nr:MAG TPA: hypothetical protein [Caudoviricetes sp.]
MGNSRLKISLFYTLDNLLWLFLLVFLLRSFQLKTFLYSMK